MRGALIREGCLRLASESALEIRSRRFFHVQDATLEHYLQLRHLRVLRESTAAELAVTKVVAANAEELRAIHQA